MEDFRAYFFKYSFNKLVYQMDFLFYYKSKEHDQEILEFPTFLKGQCNLTFSLSPTIF